MRGTNLFVFIFCKIDGEAKIDDTAEKKTDPS
jgi:hypothetical protein